MRLTERPRPVSSARRAGTRAWVDEALRRLQAEADRSADTPLHAFPLPVEWGIDLYLKDESAHPSGSLKHRLARALFVHATCNGWIGEHTTIVEASSGSTAVSEAYFAQLLGLPFVAVMPASTSPEKIALIEHHGGACRLMHDHSLIGEEAQRIADETGGHFMDQFTYAEQATDWRGTDNIAESIFTQISQERHPVPSWIVVGAGTGGTSATIGRHLRHRGHPTQLCVVDPENSAFLAGWIENDPTITTGSASRIEGIGRPRMERSFLPGVIDRMIRVPDAASIAAMRLVTELTGRSVGGSTGTNTWGAFQLAAELRAAGRHGSIVTLICDHGDRYAHSYYNDAWLNAHNLDLAPPTAALKHCLATGQWPEQAGSATAISDIHHHRTRTRRRSFAVSTAAT